MSAWTDYSHDGYCRFIDELRAEHEMLTISEWLDGERPDRYAVLRHDIEQDVVPALWLAEFDAGVGVRSTFFVRVDGPYNPFEARTAQRLAIIVSLGHELALHYDAAPSARPELLQAYAAALQERFGTPIRTMAAHNPTLHGPSAALEVPGLMNVYRSPLFSGEDITYVSDSLQAWRIDPHEALALKKLHVLLHPEYWTPDGAPWDESLARCVKRQAAETMNCAQKGIAQAKENLALREERDALFRMAVTRE